MAPVWVRTALQHLAVLAGGGVLGWLYGHLTLGLLGATALLLGWHLYHLYFLERWLRTGEHGPLPYGNGPWSQVLARIQTVREQARASRESWVRLVKELRASTKAFPDGGVVLTAEHEIIRCNKAGRQLLGLKKKRDRGMRIENLVRHPDFIRFMDQGPRKESVEIPSPLGQDRWLSCRLIPYGPEQRLLLVRDITQSVRTARTRRDFAANASHELRTPLTVIAGYLDALADDDDLPDHWAVPVREMREQADRMGRLVRDLLQLSKLESSSSSGREHEVDVAGLLRSAQRDVLALPAERRPATVELDIDSDLPVLGEETELQSVVSNLVGNAVRYTSPDGVITMGWSVDEDGGHLWVADTGIGIAPDDLPRVTERFYRTAGGRARQQGGTGLGLAIVKHALKRHDAELEIASTPGQGSRFTCHFPRDRLAAP